MKSNMVCSEQDADIVPAKDALSGSSAPLHILVVDDEINVRKTLSAMATMLCQKRIVAILMWLSSICGLRTNPAPT
jgi:hypothetical protein